MDILNLFVNGGFFMWPILSCLILGLAYSIYKAICLLKLKKMLQQELYYFSTFHTNYSSDIIQNEVQKIYSNESLELEKGMSLLSTLISLAPMLGFTGTVYGMIMAFRDIKIADEISAAVVASGIETALLTTLFGLVVAMILQLNYNMFNTIIQNSESIIVNKLMDKSNELLLIKGDCDA